ncbi:MAG TPA: hypothetical protein VJJ22_00345 [Candidatus Paceibacterota bacterium]
MTTTQALNQIKTILNTLSLSDARKVIDKLPELLQKRALENPPPAANVTTEALWNMLKSKCNALSAKYGERPKKEDEFDFRKCYDVDEIIEGTSAIEFTLENAGCDENEWGGQNWGSLIGARMFGNIPGIGCYAHGDWEYPVFFIIYLDADGKTLRSYLPKKGNVFNPKKKSAFGNNEEDDREFLLGWIQEHRPEIRIDEGRFDPSEEAGVIFNEGDILHDIAGHIHLAHLTEEVWPDSKTSD